MRAYGPDARWKRTLVSMAEDGGPRLIVPAELLANATDSDGDPLVSTGFMKHVERALPAARHVELDCGHLPQLERPRQTHAAIEKFLRTQAA